MYAFCSFNMQLGCMVVTCTQNLSPSISSQTLLLYHTNIMYFPNIPPHTFFPSDILPFFLPVCHVGQPRQCYFDISAINIQTHTHIHTYEFIWNLGTTNEGKHTVFVFLMLNLLSTVSSVGSTFLTNHIISFFFMATEYSIVCIYTLHVWKSKRQSRTFASCCHTLSR